MNTKSQRIVLLVAIALAVSPPLLQFADAQVDFGPPTCVDAGNCNSDNPFELSAMAYTNVIGPWIFPLFWGLALFMIQLLSGMPMLTSMVGVMISLMFVGSDAYTNATSATFFYYGYLLVSISIGLTLYYLIKTKIHTS